MHAFEEEFRALFYLRPNAVARPFLNHDFARIWGLMIVKHNTAQPNLCEISSRRAYFSDFGFDFNDTARSQIGI